MKSGHHHSKGKCYELGRLDGKLAIVTGANTGIGKETTAELARRGANVVMACRSLERAEAAKGEILADYGEDALTALTKNVASEEVGACLTPIKPQQLTIEQLDLSSLESVRDFAQRMGEGDDKKIDILVNNAGIMACPYEETVDGFEMQMGTNHLGPFLLTELLLPAIKRALSDARIIFLSSLAHSRTKTSLVPLNMSKEKYDRFESYSRTKLANAMYAYYLANELESSGIKTASVHPGVVQTELFRSVGFYNRLPKGLTKMFLKTPWKGAQTTLFTMLTPNLKSGAYYADCKEARPHHLVYNLDAAKELVTASREAVGLA